MSGSENKTIVGVAQKRTVSAQRRLQNRFAQQRYRERQKINAATGADQPDATAPNDADAVGAVHAVESVDTVGTPNGEGLYYLQESEFLSDYEGPVSSSWGLNNAPFQWHTSSVSSGTSSPQIQYTFDAMLESDIKPNPSHLDITFEGLFALDPREAESYQRYLQQPVGFWAESNDGALARPQRLIASEVAIPPAENTPPSASPTPPHRSPANPYSPNSSSSASSTSSMDQLFATQPSGICYTPSPTRLPLLHVAIRTRKKSMIRLLLRRGVATINEQDSDGRTALHVAAQSGDEEMVETLVKHGADPKIIDKHGLDAIHYAVTQGHEEIVEILLDAIAGRE